MRVLVVLLVAAGVAFANPKAAAVHDRQAKAYFDAKQFDDAIAEFKKSYDLVKKAVTLFKIATAYYQKRDFQSAIDFYGQYLQADPDGPLAKEALQFTTIAKQELEAAKQAEADKRAAEEAAKKQAVVTGHVTNAQEFVKANAWASAGDEYVAAVTAGGDIALMIDAGDAYARVPDHVKARDAYRTYIDRAPTGPRAADARAKFVIATNAIEQAEKQKQEAERARLAALEAKPQPERPPEKPAGPPPIARGIASYGVRAAAGFSQPDTNPYQMSSSDGLVAQPSFDVGAFVRYHFTTQVAIRPEASLIYRGASFDGRLEPGESGCPAGGQTCFKENAVTVTRAGLQIVVPLWFAVSESRKGFRLGVGPFVALMPYSSNDRDPIYPSPGDTTFFDFGLLAGIEIDFGIPSLEARFSKSFGSLTQDVDATMYTVLLGVTIGFDR